MKEKQLTAKELKEIELSFIGGLNMYMDLLKKHYCNEVTPNDIFEFTENGYRVIPSIYMAFQNFSQREQNKIGRLLIREISGIFPLMNN